MNLGQQLVKESKIKPTLKRKKWSHLDPPTQEHRDAISRAKMGIKHTEETKIKIGIARKLTAQRQAREKLTNYQAAMDLS